jgi:CRISPR system Cascade subunit CasA
MHEANQRTPTYNLWFEPWISLERDDGITEILGLEQVLLKAQDYRAIYEVSPLNIVGIHRLLTAILQEMLNPKSVGDLNRIKEMACFPETAVHSFGEHFSERFDLFSEKAPFLQSADIPLTPPKNSKPVTYLTQEIPAGTEITHYRHGADMDHILCSACAARGLVCIPAFATSGGAGIKPSINGVPPIYVLPSGETLLESLAASLLRPDRFPPMASIGPDLAWWHRESIVKRTDELVEVGYLHSLTFPARRVRLFPEAMNTSCTRCGSFSTWGVRLMVFEMGECRSKESEPWRDPFAAYTISKEKDKPIPVRPNKGKAMWREYGSLFLKGTSSKKKQSIRPAVLDQIDECILEDGPAVNRFRCIGIRTDMKAKVFEWVDQGFETPPPLLRDETAGVMVQDAIDFSVECASVIAIVFKRVFTKQRFENLRSRMLDAYWGSLADPFRQFIMALAVDEKQEVAADWLETVVQHALDAFIESAKGAGEDADMLKAQMSGETLCRIRLAKLKKDRFINDAREEAG